MRSPGYDEDSIFVGFLSSFSAMAVGLMIATLRMPPPPEIDMANVPVREISMLQAMVPEELALPRAARPVLRQSTRARPVAVLHQVAHDVASAEHTSKAAPRSKLLDALLGTHGEAQRDASTPDIFDQSDTVGASLALSLEHVSGAELASADGPGLKTAQGDRGDSAGSVLGRGGGGEAGVSAGPSARPRGPVLGSIGTAGAPTGQADSIRADATRQVRGLQSCYDAALKANPSLSGRLVLELRVKDGVVSGVSFPEDQIGSDTLLECATVRARTWHFAAGTTVDLTMPLDLSAAR